mmetsp:Transcript_22567/g.45313  ORF Transcript_22567/g.45313 Transcript_22567/m.45313 type:complete len:160 (-) Transcript_22567:241-720(-)
MFRATRILRRALRAEGAAGATSDGLLFRFNTPSTSIITEETVKMVLVPAVSGDFGILAGHVPVIAQLKPGVVSVHKTDTDIKHYFVSGGFAVVREDATASVTAAEAVEVSELDPAAVKAGITTFTNEIANAKTDEEKTNAEIGLEVHQAMDYAISLTGN